MATFQHYSSDEFKGKRVVVTGGTEGQGRAVVERMLLGGARVLTTARSKETGDLPSNVEFVPADLSTSEGCNKVITEVLSRFDGVDILINVVGGSSAPNGGFAVLNDEEWWKE